MITAMTWFLILAYLILAQLVVWIIIIQRHVDARFDDIERTIAAMATRIPEPEDPERMIRSE